MLNNKGPKIALAMIVKGTDVESDVLYRCLTTEGLHLKFDEIVIVITYKDNPKEGEKVKLVAEQAKAKIFFKKWNDDFAEMRNYSFSKVSKEMDFVIWLDADDIVKGAKYIKNIIQKADDNIDGIILPYLYDFNEHNECTVKHNKIRIIRNNNSYEWKGKLHEDLIEKRKVINYFSKDIQICHLTNHKRIDIAIERNYRITKKDLEDNKSNARVLWNHANSSFMAGKFKESIETFFEFIQKSGSEEEIYLAWNRISNIFFITKDYERSIESALEALRIRPWYPDAYYSLAQSNFNARKFKHAKEFLTTGLTKTPPENQTIVWNPRDYDFNPLMLLAKTFYQLNQPHEALRILEGTKSNFFRKTKFHKGLIEMFPKNTELQKYANEIKRICEELDMVDKICKKIEKCNTKEKIKKLLNSVPDKLKSHPKLCYLRNIHFVKTESSGKDLDIYCFETAENWNPEIAKTTGMGGSEEAVLNMAPKLADLGWNVTVYNSCGHEAKKYGKVLWKPHWEFNYRNKTDIVISWRTPILYSHPVNAKKKYVWLHDTIPQNEFTQQRLQNINNILVLSKYHRKLYPDIPDNKFIITSNGINPKQFNNWKCPNCKNKDIEIGNEKYRCDKCGYRNGKEEPFQIIKRDPYKLLYTAAQDRGLELVLKLFPKIKKEVPEATLDICYGWETWLSVYQEDLPKMEWRKKILEMQEQDGVKDFARITHEEVAKKYLKSSIYFYPTEFTEISCISLMKAQAGGAIPVTTNIAALSETVQFGKKIKCNDIYSNEAAQNEIVDYVVDLLKNPHKQERIRKEMIPWAKQNFNWDQVVKDWNNEFIKK